MPELKKVLVFAPFNMPPNFLGLNLEFVQREIDAGNEVVFMTCAKTFPTCGFNTYGLRYMCEVCVQRFKDNKHLVKGEFEYTTIKEGLIPSDNEFATENLKNIDRVSKTWKVNEFEVGESVMSSVISKTREKEFTSDEDNNMLRQIAHQSLIVYHALLRFISDRSISKVILFNGRWDYYRASLAAAQAKAVEIEIIENFKPNGYYEAFGGNLPHNISTRMRLINEHWVSVEDNAGKEAVAHDFFKNKRKGIVVYDRSYTAGQEEGLMFKGWNPQKKLIVLYNSSDFEYEAVGKEYGMLLFPNQQDSIGHVARLVSTHPEFQLVIRMHPNLKGLKAGFLKSVYDLEGKYQNVFVIHPGDPVDSYVLMDHASKVVTYGSTVGIESTYWGKPVVLLGKSIYSYADVAYSPESLQELEHLILADLQPKPRVNAERYGYYYATGGLKTKHFKYDSTGSYFNGKRMDKLSRNFKLYYRLLKLLKIKN